MFSESYTLKREQSTPYSTIVTNIAIRLENMPENTKDHSELKKNLLKYISFQSVKRLSPGVYNICDGKCKETLELTFDDIKIALTSAFEVERYKYNKQYDELAARQGRLIDEFETIDNSYKACIKEIDEKIEQIPTNQAKKIDLKDEINILEEIIRKKKYDLVKLEN